MMITHSRPGLFLYFCLLVSIFTTSSIVEGKDCDFYDLSVPVHTILCAVETGTWKVSSNSPALENAGCLIGKNRCNQIMNIPTEAEVPPSPPPPDAKNPTYQQLALKAEAVVPKTWWRAGYADKKLHLSHTNDQLPRKLFDSRVLSNKKLKNIYQCVTRQQFMRKSFDFLESIKANASTPCTAMSSSVAIRFFKLWQKYKSSLDGIVIDGKDVIKVWYPSSSNEGELLMAASEVLEHFYTNYGGIWTGCFAYEKSAVCRGLLAAASLVVAAHTISDIAGRGKGFSETQFTRGYILSSLGRGLLHGDSHGTGTEPITSFHVRLNDFIALQAAYLKLYIASFGKIYNEQLNKYIPMAFSPGFQVYAKPQWKEMAGQLEPVYSSLRNWMFTECSNLIDFGPYRPLVAFDKVRDDVQKKRRVLIDVGANGFFASPKSLIDSYSIYLPFTDVIMVEPEPHFSATIPKAYSTRYNITFLQIYAEVATGSKTDMLKLLPTLVTKDDFVVLKFDVDPNRYAYGPTIEWGFMFSTLQTPEIAALVDELYVELHFNFPSLYWKHYHSNWEALDAFRYLRQEGAIVHSWP